MSYDPKFYYSPRWRAFRAAFLAANPRCVFCGRPATVVDHIVSRAKAPDRALDPTNCQALDAACHNRKSRLHEQRHKTGRYKPVVPGSDASGAPLDPSHPWHR